MPSAVVCFVIAVLAVVLGYAAIGAALAGVAKLLFILGSAARLRTASYAPGETL